MTPSIRIATLVLLVAASSFQVATVARAQGTDVTAPGDAIVGIASTPASSTSTLAIVGSIGGFNNYPALESPPNAIDNLASNKYLNFQKVNSGFIVTPSASTIVGGLRFTTGNDSPERDPLTLVLQGTNDANATVTLNSTWVTIYTGITGLATDPGRNMLGATVSFANASSYVSYRMLVQSVRDIPLLANSVQFAEIELFAGQAGTGFCFGDGSGTACPCANFSPVGDASGCMSSVGTGGKLVASGSPSLGADTVVLGGTQMPNSSALYFQGTTQAGAGLGAVFGDGLRCAAGTIVRLGTTTNVGGSSHYPGAANLAVSVKGQIAAPGTRTYQCWYRNAATFCNAPTFNLTNGWTITWTP